MDCAAQLASNDVLPFVRERHLLRQRKELRPSSVLRREVLQQTGKVVHLENAPLALHNAKAGRSRIAPVHIQNICCVDHFVCSRTVLPRDSATAERVEEMVAGTRGWLTSVLEPHLGLQRGQIDPWCVVGAVAIRAG